MTFKDDVVEVLNRVIGERIEGVKLGPGVVGRNSSIAWALEFVMLAGVIAGGFLHSIWLVGISLFGAIGGGLLIACMNVRFGNKNPAAALMEGAQFLQYHQLQAIAIKGSQSTELSPAPATRHSIESPGNKTNLLQSDEELNS